MFGFAERVLGKSAGQTVSISSMQLLWFANDKHTLEVDGSRTMSPAGGFHGFGIVMFFLMSSCSVMFCKSVVADRSARSTQHTAHST
jgi:hypothetical protein